VKTAAVLKYVMHRKKHLYKMLYKAHDNTLRILCVGSPCY